MLPEIVYPRYPDDPITYFFNWNSVLLLSYTPLLFTVSYHSYLEHNGLEKLASIAHT